jgi:hypothetical protein
MDEKIPLCKFHNSPHSCYETLGVSTKANLISHSQIQENKKSNNFKYTKLGVVKQFQANFQTINRNSSFPNVLLF